MNPFEELANAIDDLRPTLQVVPGGSRLPIAHAYSKTAINKNRGLGPGLLCCFSDACQARPT